MSSAHIAALYFDGRPKAAAKRLRTLKRARLIAERPRLPQQQSILFLTKKGYHLLSENGGLDGYPKLGWELLRKRLQVSPLTVQHELAVMNVKAAFIAALRKHERFSVVEFSTWPRLFQFRARPHSSGRILWMRPDGCIHVREKTGDAAIDHCFYLEVDRSTEVLDILRAKAGCYLYHYQSGGLAAKFHQPREQYKHFPFRTLWIFRSERRRNNAAEMLLGHRPPVLASAWLTTMEQFSADPLGTVWIRPIDYRNAKAAQAQPSSGASGQTGQGRSPLATSPLRLFAAE